MKTREYQEIINKLQHDSKHFSKLKPQEQLFVAYYCNNGFKASAAAKAVKASSPTKFTKSDEVNASVEEFITEILADKASKMKSMIIDVLWRRAFYNIMDFVDEDGQPRFDVNNYKEKLGADAVVIDGIKQYVHSKNTDHTWVEVQLADRNKALKELSNYIGLSTSEESDGAASFVVNINMHKNKETGKIQECKAPQIV